VLRTATICISLRVAKCGSICRAQTCALSGVEQSRSAKAFLHGGPKSLKKIQIFHHFETLRHYMCLLPFWGLAAPRGEKKGEMKFSLLYKSMGNFCILVVLERYLSNAWTDPRQTLYVQGQCLSTCPLPLWDYRPLGAGEGELKTLKMGVVSFMLRTATISVFLSVAKCGLICRAQTCPRSGIKPSTLDKGFLQGEPKVRKNFEFDHF